MGPYRPNREPECSEDSHRGGEGGDNPTDEQPDGGEQSDPLAAETVGEDPGDEGPEHDSAHVERLGQGAEVVPVADQVKLGDDSLGPVAPVIVPPGTVGVSALLQQHAHVDTVVVPGVLAKAEVEGHRAAPEVLLRHQEVDGEHVPAEEEADEREDRDSCGLPATPRADPPNDRVAGGHAGVTGGHAGVTGGHAGVTGGPAGVTRVTQCHSKVTGDIGVT